jgi:hypothetical protein
VVDRSGESGWTRTATDADDCGGGLEEVLEECARRRLVAARPLKMVHTGEEEKYLRRLRTVFSSPGFLPLLSRAAAPDLHRAVVVPPPLLPKPPPSRLQVHTRLRPHQVLIVDLLSNSPLDLEYRWPDEAWKSGRAAYVGRRRRGYRAYWHLLR